TRREIRVRDPVRASRRCGPRFFLETENEVRAREHRFERRADAILEPTPPPPPTRPPPPTPLTRPPRPPSLNPPEPIDFTLRQRPPVRLACNLREDLPRTRTLLAGARRPAGEDPSAAGRFGNAGRLVRALDDEISKMRKRRDAWAARASARKRPIVRTNQILVRAVDL